MRNKIDFVVATYNPDKEVFSECIESIKNQVNNIIVIDNASNFDISTILDQVEIENKEFKIIKLKENKGIAYALNRGIELSLESNSDYILISDQDTIYPQNYINEMLSVFEKSTDHNIVAIVPLFADVNKKRENEGFYKETLFGYKKFYPKKGTYSVFQAISSGMILKTKNLKKIGLFNENLFIDWVDFEWCWRANKKGYKILGNADVLITHSLGNQKVNLKYREVNLRNPIRHYYITRNAFYLALYDKNLTFLQKFFLFVLSFKYLIGYPLLSKPHIKNLSYVFKGFFHGILGKLGKLK